MALNWIKLEKDTPRKPEILRMARRLGADPDAIFGKWVRLWAWLDSNTVDGVVDGVVSTDVDAMVSTTNFAAEAESVGWLIVDDENERVVFPNFDRHNGESAKKRAAKAERQRTWRKSKDSKPAHDVDASVDAGASTREEKRRNIPAGRLGPAVVFESVWEKARPLARQFARLIEPDRPLKAKDRELAAKAACIGVGLGVDQHLLSVAEGIATKTSQPDRPWAYFRKALIRIVNERGGDGSFDGIWDGIDVPEIVINPPVAAS